MGNAARRVVGYGQGTAEIDLDADAAVSRALLARLRAVFSAPDYRPPVLPGAAIQLLELTKKPDVTVDQILALLEKDPMMCGALLRKARSAHYSRGSPVQSLREAIVRLGLQTITHLFFEVAMGMRVFRAPGYEEPMAKLRKHSAAVAQVAQQLARSTCFFDEYAFLCGLIHDVGIAACTIAIAESAPRGNPPPSFAAIAPALFEVHAEAGRALAGHWGLPSDVQLVVGHHHDRGVDGKVHPLVAILAIAEAVADESGFGLDLEGAGDVAWALRAIGMVTTVEALAASMKPVLARIGE